MIASKSRHSIPRQNRRKVRLRPGMEKSLSAYASAAVAAGVGLLAVSKSAEAKIVYTPANTAIPVNQSGVSVYLDLNHDGIDDFSFWNYSFGGGAGGGARLGIGCIAPGGKCVFRGNRIWGRGIVERRFASALRAGFTVGPNRSYLQAAKFQSRFENLATMAFNYVSGTGPFTISSTAGQWGYTKNRFVGLQFVIGGQIHYGWARLSVSQPGRFGSVTLTGYAYETVPNKPIITGKTKGPDVITLDPATLGRLAQGASGISPLQEKK
jgi:hypothetical protein